ncbi:MAG: secondary thiamine-phosphate synthase enzyme YjbQ [Spirochaetota bacterium]
MVFTSLKINTQEKTGFIDISGQIKKTVMSAGIGNGLCSIYIPHTTAGVTINEAADPSVERDILKELNKIVPFQDGYDHREGNSAAHIKASLVGSGVTIPICQGKLVLGTWQGIFFCEFDGPRTRTIYVSLLS